MSNITVATSIFDIQVMQKKKKKQPPQIQVYWSAWEIDQACNADVPFTYKSVHLSF